MNIFNESSSVFSGERIRLRVMVQASFLGSMDCELDQRSNCEKRELVEIFLET